MSNIVSPANSNWSSSASDYNDLYSSNANTTGEWGSGTNQTFAQWQSSSAGEANSANKPVSFITSDYDLQPDAISNCALNNTGTPITTPVVINTDINNSSRSATTPDLGAYEFNYAAFTIAASNNSPVCAGETVDLSVDAGNAFNPTFSWSNAADSIVSTSQNPTVAASAGRFKIIVTDANGCYVTDSTMVILNARPTASITGAVPICEGGDVTLNLNVTGTGAISGTLSDGENFSGTAPLITVTVSPTSTTSYSISSLSDESCSAVQADIPDTATIVVTQSGSWLGINSSDWNDPANWCGGVPLSTTNVSIPAGLSNYPVITTGTNAVNNITIQSGASLTVNNAVLQIAGAITNNGTFSAGNGSIEMNDSLAQSIPAATFSGNTIKNLIINNSASVNLGGTLNLSGVLKITSGQFNTGGHLTLLSTETQTALIDGSGAGEVLGNITMQRYLASGFGYKYFSSPFQAAKVSEFSDDVNLTSSFPSFYKYDEDRVATGWVNYTDPNGLLVPLQGYAANFGTSASAKTVDITGVANNGTLSTTLYNHNRPFTKGFNLVGNPYASPIDWDAANGWVRTNIDNAVYYFNASDTDQYTGTYSSYINGISSDGVAGNIIPSMQGFFVHVSNGTFPVTAQLEINNDARTNDLSPVFHSFSEQLLRVSASFADEEVVSDATVFYFDESAPKTFDKKLDALKLMNTNSSVPSLYAVSADSAKLSIRAVTYPRDSVTVLPLGLKTEKEGWITFNAKDIQEIPANIHIYLSDDKAGTKQDLRHNPRYRLYLKQGEYENRFSIVFSVNELVSNTGGEDTFNVYNSGSRLFVNSNIQTDEKSILVIVNMSGQSIQRWQFKGNGTYDLNSYLSSGIYIVNLFSNKEVHSKKIFIGNQ